MTLNFDLPLLEFNKQVTNINAKFALPKPGKHQDCDAGTFTLTNSQKFISSYFTSSNPNGLLIYHSIGSGKTLTAVNLLKHFEDHGFNTIWVTRTTLKKDLSKALSIIPLKKLSVYSYKQFSNIAKRKGKNYTLLLEKAISDASLNKETTNDPLYNSIVVIDEAHKLFTRDLKSQELHSIKDIQNMIFDSYTNSKGSRVRIVLMSATPITENPLEIVHLLNLIITNPMKRITDIVHKKSIFGDVLPDELKEKIKGLVSYLDVTKDVSKFAQVKFINVLVPVSEALSKTNCKLIYSGCMALGQSKLICTKIARVCKERESVLKDRTRGIVFQRKALNECNK